MSVSRGNGQNGGHYYSNITKPVKINLNFIVDSSNANGLGIRSLKSNGYVQAVYMHTSATPASGNPNPAAGFALVVLNNNYNVSLGSKVSIASPVTGSNLTSTTVNVSYIITGLGTASAAQWAAAGVPAGLTAAVGMSFVALQSASIGGSATVKAVGVSGVVGAEVVGNPSLSLNNSNIALNGGGQVLIQFLGATNSSTTTLIAKNPADESVVSMELMFDGSSVTIDGL